MAMTKKTSKRRRSRKTAPVYTTLSEAPGFREIATHMSKAGFDMNHASARNVVYKAMTRMISFIYNDLVDEGIEPKFRMTKTKLDSLLQDSGVQECLREVMQQAHNELMEEGFEYSTDYNENECHKTYRDIIRKLPNE